MMAGDELSGEVVGDRGGKLPDFISVEAAGVLQLRQALSMIEVLFAAHSDKDAVLKEMWAQGIAGLNGAVAGVAKVLTMQRRLAEQIEEAADRSHKRQVREFEATEKAEFDRDVWTTVWPRVQAMASKFAGADLSKTQDPVALVRALLTPAQRAAVRAGKPLRLTAEQRAMLSALDEDEEEKNNA